MSEAALDLVYALINDDGRRWGDVAADFQVEDAAAVLSDEKPHLHWISRARGGAKTGDAAALSLAWLATTAPPRARGYVIAANADQAGLLVDAAGGYCARTPGLDGFLTIENERIAAPNGASIRVLPASDAGAWGLLNTHWLICDEFCQWPATRGAQRVWTAVRSTVQKRRNTRLVIISSAGEPSHWTYQVYQKALADPENWRVHEVPGPVPWQDSKDIEALRRELLPSEFDRLVLNRWSESEDRVVSPEDYAAAAMPATRYGLAPAGIKGGGWRLRHPRADAKYIVCGDLGLVHDATVLVVAHAEQLTDDRHGPKRLVVDHLERWQGNKLHRVQLRDIEARIVELSSEYNRAPVHLDPDQAQGLLQSLALNGVSAREFTFSLTSVGQVATALVQAFHNRLIEVPDSPELRSELLAVKLRDTGHGIPRLDHDRSGHDDQAVAIGMAAHLLLARSAGSTAAFVAHMQRSLAANADPSTAQSREMRAFQRGARQIMAKRARFGGSELRRAGQCQHYWRVMADGRHVCVSGGPGGGGGCGAIREEIS